MHGIIIEFIDPKDNTRRSATYLPEVAAHEGEYSSYFLSHLPSLMLVFVWLIRN